MKNHEKACVAVQVVGVYFAANSLLYLPMLIERLRDFIGQPIQHIDYGVYFAGVVIPFSVLLVCALICLFGGATIGRMLLGISKKDEATEPLTKAQVLRISLFLIGIFFLATSFDSLPETMRLQAQVGYAMPEAVKQIQANTRASMLHVGTRAVVGLLLMLSTAVLNMRGKHQQRN